MNDLFEDECDYYDTEFIYNEESPELTYQEFGEDLGVILTMLDLNGDQVSGALTYEAVLELHSLLGVSISTLKESKRN